MIKIRRVPISSYIQNTVLYGIYVYTYLQYIWYLVKVIYGSGQP
jgi:hypothetical protein